MKVIFFTSGSGSYVMPQDFLSLVSIEVLGGGAGASGNYGSGAGAYSKSTTTSISRGSVIYYSIGAGGAGGVVGGDTWINVGTNAAPTSAAQGALAKGGAFSSVTYSGGGAAASGVGDIKYSGGNGYYDSIGGQSGTSGGGGAAGPGGNGGDGSPGVAANGGNGGRGGGGGGATLTGPGQAAGAASLTQGATGGNNGDGIGGGAGATASILATTPTNGGGGGGGFGGGGLSNGIPGYGTNGTIWTSTHVYNGSSLIASVLTTGPGGGGGGSGGLSATGGNGGLGAGGGGSYTIQPGSGGAGIAVLTYNALANYNTNLYTPTTGYISYDAVSGSQVDLGSRYVTKSYLLDVYPNISSTLGARTTPGLWACGYNYFGYLGINTPTSINYSSPVQVGSLTNWKQVSISGMGAPAFGVKTDGTLWAWGQNQSGSLGIGSSATLYYSSPVQVGALTNWKQVSTTGILGTGSTPTVLAINNLGQLFSWGYGGWGALGNNQTLANSSAPIQIGLLTSWKQVFMGGRHATAVKTDGTLWVWGNNFSGQLGLNNLTSFSSPVQVGTSSYWKQVAANYNNTFAITSDGRLFAWGDNSIGSLGLGNTSNTYSSPVQVGSLANWKSVNCSINNVTAIKTDGTLWTWGTNSHGQLGLGFAGLVNYSSPVQVGSLTNWKSAASGQYHTVAIKTDGTLWAWGANFNGQLGLGHTVEYYSPVQVGSLTTWKSAISGGNSFSSFFIADGYI